MSSPGASSGKPQDPIEEKRASNLHGPAVDTLETREDCEALEEGEM